MNCLGLYIGKNIIKYAKVSRDNNSSIKVETYGIKYYTNLDEAINQIIVETDSSKIPISVNVEGETYNYLSMSNLLKRNDLNKAINTEFESICYEKSENPNALATRFALVNHAKEKNKTRVIHVAVDKIKLNQIENTFKNAKLTTIIPISFGIANIVPIQSKENAVVVNIEDTTTITIIEGEKIYEVRQLKAGANDILEKINHKENSYAKAYEICKNTTIYTMQSQNPSNGNEYLQDIIPTLYEIASEVKNIVETTEFKINKVYITGTAAIINNIDLYFNEIIKQELASVLKPFFLSENAQTNIKDYIEVNSAIAIALQGVDYGLKDINFSKGKSGVNLSLPTFSKTSGSKDSKQQRKMNIDFSGHTMLFVRFILVAVIATMIIYIGLEEYTKKEIENKEIQLEQVINNTKTQIGKIQLDTQKINNKASEYSDLTQNLQNAKASLDEKNSYKNSITTLLTRIEQIIPKGVQLISIENPTSKNIIINAQSLQYEQLAYFKARLKQEGILIPETVVSSQAVKVGNDKLLLGGSSVRYEAQVIRVVIEGELP